MPNKEGKLSEEEQERVKKWVDDHDGHTCPICKGSNRALGDYIVRIPLSEKPSFHAAVLIFCEDCGNIRFYEITSLGISLLNREPEKDE